MPWLRWTILLDQCLARASTRTLFESNCLLWFTWMFDDGNILSWPTPVSHAWSSLFTLQAKRQDMPEHYLTSDHQLQVLANIFQPILGRNKASSDPLSRERVAQQLQVYWEYSELFQSALRILTDDKTRLTGEKEQLATAVKALMDAMDQLRQHERKSKEKLEHLFETDAQMERDMTLLKQSDSTIDVPILDDHATVTCLFSFTQSENAMIFSSKDWHRFRTSRFGYEFLLRGFFTDDMDRAYLSLVLTLCKSEYMNLLPFPFRYNLYIVLWDQSNAHKHLVYKLEPETRGSAFRRPTGEQNEECLMMKFCPLTLLTDRGSSYATNQTFFIRIFVDFLHDGQMPFEVDVDNPRAFSHLKTLAKVDDYAPMDWYSPLHSYSPNSNVHYLKNLSLDAWKCLLHMLPNWQDM